MISPRQSKSFERAVFEGDIHGPNWRIVDTETGSVIPEGDQNFGHTRLGRLVVTNEGDSTTQNVLDHQDPELVRELSELLTETENMGILLFTITELGESAGFDPETIEEITALSFEDALNTVYSCIVQGAQDPEELLRDILGN